MLGHVKCLMRQIGFPINIDKSSIRLLHIQECVTYQIQDLGNILQLETEVLI